MATSGYRAYFLTNGSVPCRRKSTPVSSSTTYSPVPQTISPVIRLKRHQRAPATIESTPQHTETLESSPQHTEDKEIYPPERLYKRFCETSTIHGVQDCYKAEGICPKIIWAICIIAAFLAAIFLCAQILVQFNESPLYISYIVKEVEKNAEKGSVPVQDPNRLPDVVICPFNRFNISFFRENNINNSMIEYIQKGFIFNVPYKFFWTFRKKRFEPEKEAELKQILERLGNISFAELITHASFSCNSLIEYCVSRGEQYPNGTTRRRPGPYDCCEDARPVFTVAGLCYRILGAKQDASGYGFGLTIVITTPSSEYLSPGINTLHNRGVSVHLAEQKKGMEFDMTFIPTGVHALMSLKATIYEFINSKQYQCLANEKVPYSYSAIQCFDDCFFRPAMSVCGCRLVSASEQSEQFPMVCTPQETMSCLFPAMHNKTQEDKDHFNRCLTNCKQTCTYWTYQPSVSYAKFPANTVYQYLPGELSESEKQKWENKIILDVFFEKLEYTVIKHMAAMTGVTFIANLGGQIGLWCGASVLSILQVFTLLIGLCMNSIRRNYRNNSSSTSTRHAEQRSRPLESKKRSGTFLTKLSQCFMGEGQSEKLDNNRSTVRRDELSPVTGRKISENYRFTPDRLLHRLVYYDPASGELYSPVESQNGLRENDEPLMFRHRSASTKGLSDRHNNGFLKDNDSRFEYADELASPISYVGHRRENRV